MNELKDLISRYFHGTEGYNCYQAVLKIIQIKNPSLNITEDDINEGRQFGGGRAPEGLCGALFSILKNAKTEKEYNRFKENFSSYFNNEITCRGIKGQKIFSCNDCVLNALRVFLEK